MSKLEVATFSSFVTLSFPPAFFGCFVSIYLFYSVHKRRKTRKSFLSSEGKNGQKKKEKPRALTAAVNHLLPASC